MTRRQFLAAGRRGGLGMLALAAICWPSQWLAGRRGEAATTRWRRKLGHFPAKAKSVIWLFMEGARARSIFSIPSRS